MKRVKLPQGQEVYLVEAAELIAPGSERELLNEFSVQRDLPILQGDAAHDYFTLIRVMVPFEKAGTNHRFYSGRTMHGRGERGVVAKITSEGMATIGGDGCWFPVPQVLSYEKVHGHAGRNENGYRHLLGYSNRPVYFISGEEEVRDQLKLWGVNEGRVASLLSVEDPLPF